MMTREEKVRAAKIKFAQEKWQAEQQGQEQEPAGPGTSFASGVNKGLAFMAGAPMSAAATLGNLAVDAVGHGLPQILPTQELRDYAGEKLRAFLEKFKTEGPAPGGIDDAQAIAERLGLIHPKPGYPILERAGEEIGASLVPMGAGLRAAGNIRRTYGAFNPIIESFRNRPGISTVEELSRALTAGVAAGAAREVAPDSPMAEVGAQFVGGMLAPINNIGPAIRTGKTGIQRVLEPLTPGGAERSAARQLAKAMNTSPEEAIRILRQAPDAVPGSALSPAQEIGDPNLLKLEAAMNKNFPRVEQELTDKAAQTQRAMMAESGDIRGTGTKQGAQDYFKGRIDQAVSKADEIIDKAMLKARTKIESLPDGATTEQSSRIVRESIEEAYKTARAAEGKLWAAVDNSAPTPTENTYRAYESAKNSLKKADDMPEVIERQLGRGADDTRKLLPEEAFDEVKAFRTKVMDEIRAEYAKPAPDRNKIRILEEIQEAALKDMESSSAAMSGEFQAARDFSRQVNEQFKEGIIGKVRGHERSGGLRVGAGETLDDIMKRGGAGGENLDRLLKVAGDDPEALAAVESYIKRRFTDQVTDHTGTVSPNAAKRFIEQNEAALNRFPDLKKQLFDVRQAQEIAASTSKRLGARKAGILDKARSRAALYIDGDVKGGINKVLNSGKPVENMKQLVRQANADQTGMAIKGLKADFMDTMMDAASAKKGGETVLSSKDLWAFLEKNMGVIRELFSPEEITRINRIASTAAKLERGAGMRSRDMADIIDESPDALVDLVARVVGARIGAKAGQGSSGASIQTAHIGASKMRQFVSKLPFARSREVLIDAILDRNKMLDLMTKAPSTKMPKALERRMNAWMVNLFGQDYDTDNE